MLLHHHPSKHFYTHIRENQKCFKLLPKNIALRSDTFGWGETSSLSVWYVAQVSPALEVSPDIAPRRQSVPAQWKDNNSAHYRLPRNISVRNIVLTIIIIIVILLANIKPIAVNMSWFSGKTILLMLAPLKLIQAIIVFLICTLGHWYLRQMNPPAPRNRFHQKKTPPAPTSHC